MSVPITRIPVKNTGKSERRVMPSALGSPRDEMRERLLLLGMPGESKKALFRRVSDLFGWSFSRVEDLFRKEAEPRVPEMDAVRHATQHHAGASHDYSDIASRLAAIEARLAAVDPDFYRQQMAAVRGVADRVRHFDDRGGEGVK